MADAKLFIVIRNPGHAGGKPGELVEGTLVYETFDAAVAALRAYVLRLYADLLPESWACRTHGDARCTDCWMRRARFPLTFLQFPETADDAYSIDVVFKSAARADTRVVTQYCISTLVHDDLDPTTAFLRQG